MRSIDETLDGLDAAVAAVAVLDWDAVPVTELLETLDRLEAARRRATACAYDAAAAVDRHGEQALGAKSHRIIADVVRVSLGEAKRRIRQSYRLAPRTTLTGQSIAPELLATGKAWHAGALDGEHLRVIETFLGNLPGHVAPADAVKAEVFLAEQAVLLRPDQLGKLAAQLSVRLNPDGEFSDADRARQRGFTWSGQGPDGMSTAKLIATPEMRAMVDAWLAKFAAPGMCNPDDQSPTVTGEPTQQVVDRDARSHAQRQHDALAALVRGQLGDPALGQHRGLPVTVIVSATLEQMQTAAGVAVTHADGALIPMSDVIRMATHSWHYLAVFDRHTERPLYLGRSKRIATADQRIILHAKDRGCTAPGCDKPGYLSEVHHVDEWADGGLTNVDDLTFACKADHKLVTEGGWATRKLKDGTTQWIPPPHLPLRSGINTFHHPERMLPDDWDLAVE